MTSPAIHRELIMFARGKRDAFIWEARYWLPHGERSTGAGARMLGRENADRCIRHAREWHHAQLRLRLLNW